MSQSQHSTAAAAGDTTVTRNKSDNSASYEAPYIRREDHVPGSYFVHFNEGHTLEEHFAFLGIKFEIRDYLEILGIYTIGDMSDELFRKVRTDPGVRNIEDDRFGEGHRV